MQNREKRGKIMYPDNNDDRRMHPGNNEERRVYPDVTNNNMHTSPGGEPIYSEPVYREPILKEPVYNAPAYSQPVNNEPVYYSEPMFTEPVYTGQPYNEPVYGEPAFNEPVYNESQDAASNMYSPGICVSKPYPRSRNYENGRNAAQRDSGKGLVGFIRALALVLACTFFSGAAAYLVIDHHLERAAFTQAPNQVVLGGNVADRRIDEFEPAPVATASDGMKAQDIYDMARTQVVGINIDAPGLLGLPIMSPISGSGFIISSDGYILTNYHVVELAHNDSLPINVVLNDGSSFEAEVIGYDAGNDVAVIKIDAQGLNPSIIGNSDDARVGQAIFAVGNPFGDLVYTMTDGIVSALDRFVSVDGRSIRTFQFSAAVNSGNSGGPIYNTNGEVIGIVTAKAVRGNVEGIGFAIPINDAIEIATDLIEHGVVTGRALIGITGQTVSEANADYFGWEVGVYIRSVAPDSAAEAAGLEIGDIITALNHEDIDTMETLRWALRDHRAGDTTTITIWRNGNSIDLQITFDEDMYAGQSGERPRTQPDSPDPFENRP